MSPRVPAAERHARLFAEGQAARLAGEPRRAPLFGQVRATRVWLKGWDCLPFHAIEVGHVTTAALGLGPAGVHVVVAVVARPGRRALVWWCLDTDDLRLTLPRDALPICVMRVPITLDANPTLRERVIEHVTGLERMFERGAALQAKWVAP